MMYYYIHDNEFVTTDTELTENLGELTVEDYRAGKYILLDEPRVVYMQSNPDASPLEVLQMVRIGPKLSVTEGRMYKWYYENVEKVIINNRVFLIFDWRNLLQEAQVYKEIGRETMTFTVWNHTFKGSTLDVYDFLLRFGVFCCDLYRAREKHYTYMYNHPDDESYDFTIGVPQVITASFEEV